MTRQEMHELPSMLCYPKYWQLLLHTLAVRFCKEPKEIGKDARPIKPRKKANAIRDQDKKK